jgi:hypothetical protein
MGLFDAFKSIGKNLLGNKAVYSAVPQMIGAGRSTYGTNNVPKGMPGSSAISQPERAGLLDSIFPGGKSSGMAGLASMAAGQLFAPKTPKVPNFTDLSSVKALQSFQPTNFKPMDPNLESSINRGLDIEHGRQLKQLQDVYRNARPGTDYTTDSAYQRDLNNLNSSQALNRSDSMAKANVQWMQTQLQASQQEMSKLSEIAQTDIAGIMAQLGMSAQEAENFKKMFSDVGTMFLNKGINKNQSILDLFGAN